MGKETISVSVRVPRELYEMIRQVADLNKRSMAKQVELMLETEFKRNPPVITEHTYEAS